MLFEGGHGAVHSLVAEVGEAPLDLFDDVGAGFVNELADVAQDGLSEGGGLFNVGVDARIASSHGGIFSSILDFEANTKMLRGDALA